MSDQGISTKPRLEGVDPDSVPEPIARVLGQQRKKWGRPLVNHLLYARCPEIFHGAQGMWRGLDRSGHLESSLTALVNRRVAILNKCYF